jgi:tRNA (guanine-N7-)-methyltransferase
MSEGGNKHTEDVRSFGRKRGRKISARQSNLLRDVLPPLALDLTQPPPERLHQLFPVPVEDVWLEIGFGGGEHLVWQAAHNPKTGLIGCEPFEEGIVKALTAIEAQKLSNIRLHADDARMVLRWIPEASLQRAFILFPDPWPKKRHLKRRLVSRETVNLLARAVAPGGELRLATDIAEYARMALFNILENKSFRWTAREAADWHKRPQDWPETRYEQKAVRAGRRRYYFRFQRL